MYETYFVWFFAGFLHSRLQSTWLLTASTWRLWTAESMKIPSIGLKKVRNTFRSRIHSVGRGIGCRVGGRGFDCWVVPCKGVGIPESGKFLLLESGIRGTFCLWNLESRALEFGTQLKKSGLPLTIVIQIPSSTDKESRIQYLESRIQGVKSGIKECLGFPYVGWSFVFPISSQAKHQDSRENTTNQFPAEPYITLWI